MIYPMPHTVQDTWKKASDDLYSKYHLGTGLRFKLLVSLVLVSAVPYTAHPEIRGRPSRLRIFMTFEGRYYFFELSEVAF